VEFHCTLAAASFILISETVFVSMEKNMVTTIPEMPPYQLMHDVPWETYELVLHALDDRHLRITYDEGELEIMTLSFEHESEDALLRRFIDMLTYELDIDIQSGGSTTMRRSLKRKGLEADECYWIKNEKAMRGKKRFDAERDPPPDLAVEIEVTRSALNRMGIYAALRVPEVWTFDGKMLSVFLLSSAGKYTESETSRAFPWLPIKEVERFLLLSGTMSETRLLRAFSKWVRDTILPQFEAAKPKKNGNGKKSRK
jgi:Uma2 family endonuclease